MFGEVFRFELRQQIKSPLFWLIALGFAAMAYGTASSDSITIGGGIGNIHRNAPYVVVHAMSLFSVLGLFLIPIFVAGAALRDFSFQTAEMMFATSVSRAAYLGGRFAAGYAASVLMLVAVGAGLWLGSLMPWLDPARLGPTPWDAYGWVLAVMVMPNLLFLSALVFLLATTTRSMLGAYVGAIAFFVLWQIAGLALGHGNISHQTLGALADPFGLGALDLVTRYWTSSDQNTRVPGIAGVLIGNRMLWMAISVVLMGVTLAAFRPDRGACRWLLRRRNIPSGSGTSIHSSVALPPVNRGGGFAVRLAQFRRLAWFDCASVLKGTAFLVMVLFGLANLGASFALSSQLYGTSTYPVTRGIAQLMTGSYVWLLWIVLGFYAGELVWRERSERVDGLVDAFPTPDWIPLLSKVTALAFVAVAFLAAGSLFGMGFQLVRGFQHLQLLLYGQFLVLDLLGFILFAILAVFLQVISNNKFTGYALLVAFIVGTIALAQLHFDDHLYRYGSAPDTPYSDMNGFGTFWTGTLWFRAYWFCFAVALLVLAGLYWVRGTTSGWHARGRIARQRLRRPAGVLLIVSLAGFVATGWYAYHNTHGLYRFQTHDQRLRQQADYEKSLRRYVDLPQPRITEVNVNVAMYPDRRRVDIDGRYVLVNRHDRPIQTLLVQLPSEGQVETSDYKVDVDFPAHSIEHADPGQGFYLYRLASPLQPGASMEFHFREHIAYHGFSNEPAGKEYVRNGTFFDNGVFPHFCYDPERELTDNNDRRKYGLGAPNLLPPRGNRTGEANNLISCDADWVKFQATLSTGSDQIALAPGYLQRQWNEGGRRYFHYVQDTPILDFFSFQSARYLVERSKWNDVNLEVYYDPRHAYNVQRILKAMKLALEYCSANFGPFQFRQLRILEFPDYREFAQSFANTVPYSESFVLQDLRKAADIDYVTYVTAHETAHQWWGHQAIGGRVEGVTMLDESLAQYSALMVMKHLYGPDAMRKFLKYELDSYLSGRGGDRIGERPLATMQPIQEYIHYRKGSVIFYALQDYMGEARVNSALRNWLHAVKFQQPPYTDTRDLIGRFRAEGGPSNQGLITSFFDRITLYDDRMVKANARRRPDGRYDVTMHVHAARYTADEKGNEIRLKLDMPIKIGVFAQAASAQEQDETPLYLARYPVKDGDSTITVTVTGRPYEAGIDPFNELVDRVSEGKRALVTVE